MKKNKKKRLAAAIVDQEKKKTKKNLKRKLRRAVGCVCGGAFLLGTGYFLGVHHRVIAAYLKGEELPPAPKGHCCR